MWSSRLQAAPPVNLVGAARGGTQEDLRRHNLSTVLSVLHAQGPMSRAELTEVIGLNRSTIAGLVGELSSLGVVNERDAEGSASGAGRPSLIVEPDRQAIQVLAVDIGVDRLAVAAVGLTGWVSARRRISLEPDKDVHSTIEAIKRLYHDVRAEIAPTRIAGIAASIPGVVRQRDGLVRLAPNLAWSEVPFGAELVAAFPELPVLWGNDADLGLLGESRRGSLAQIGDAVFLAGEVGVGGGILVAGHTLSGADGFAGEFGHMLVRPNGRQCRCGSRGCWETEIGAPAIARSLGLPEQTSCDHVIAALARCEPGTAEQLREVGRYLGRGLSIVVNVVNPRRVVIGGLLAHVYPLISETVLEHFERSALPGARDEVQISTTVLGDEAALIGAAELAWAELLRDPARLLRVS